MSKEYPGYTKCFIDVETTGVDRKLNEIWQISGAIVDRTDKVLERFDFKFMPFSLEHASDEALAHSGMTVAKLCELSGDPRKVYESLLEIFGKYCNKFDKNDKMQLIAYNSGFDSEFLREFWAKNNDNYFGSWFWTPAVCVMQMSAAFLIDVRGALPNFKLGTLCQSAGLGWDDSKAHDAAYDINQTIRLYNFLRDNTLKLGE